jgi:hypothetical protein
MRLDRQNIYIEGSVPTGLHEHECLHGNKAFDRQHELGHELRQTKAGQYTPTHMWKDIRNAMRIYTRFHVTGGVLTVLDEEHMQDTHGKILL